MASDGTTSDQFGWSVAVFDNTLTVGSPGLFDSIGSGAAYIFGRNKNTNMMAHLVITSVTVLPYLITQ